jgi:hypothetical protein
MYEIKKHSLRFHFDWVMGDRPAANGEICVNFD